MHGVPSAATSILHQKPAILAIFTITYLAIAIGHIPGLKLNRAGIALLGGIAMMIFGGVSTEQVISYINWPTVFLLFGFFVISAQLCLSGFYDKVATAIAAGLSHPRQFLLVLMAATAGLSAVLNHDIVCFVFTPIVCAALLRKQLNPVPFLVALAIASNIGAAATIIGNPQNMMISQVGRLDFAGYLIWCAIPALVAFVLSYLIVWLMSRQRLQYFSDPEVKSRQSTRPYNRPHTIKGLIILMIVIGLFFSPLPKEIIVLAAAGIHLASAKFRTNDLLSLVDWPILVLFMGLFVVTGAFQATGCGDQAVQWLAHAGFNLSAPANLTLITAALSNLINNSAAVFLLVKVVNISNHTTAYVLALANSFGGSLIIVGSVSNIIVVQQARDMGVKISFSDFARLGVPTTLAALAGLLTWVWLAT